MVPQSTENAAMHAFRSTVKFPLGQLVATPGALDALAALGLSGFSLVRRHVCGDWSEMGTDDQASNIEAVERGSRVFSAYTYGKTRFWVITEADRSATTILLPSEY